MKTFIVILFLSLVLATTLSIDNVHYNFTNKVILVSGGNGGIGYASALEFARSGGKVIITARDSHPNWIGTDRFPIAMAAENINNDIGVKSTGGRAYPMVADMKNKTAVQKVIDYIDSLFGKLDIVCNIAGIGGLGGRIHEIDEDGVYGVHDPIMNNVYSVFWGMKLSIKYWARKKRKQEAIIVNFSSYNGIRACVGCQMYAASKHAIAGLTKSVALEYIEPSETTPRVRVNAICPGLIDTPLTRNQAKTIVEGIQPWQGPLVKKSDPMWQKVKKEWVKGVTGGRLGEAVEMANLVLFLASEKASYLSGEIISNDNGSSAK